MESPVSPFVRWDGLHLVFDLAHVEGWVNHLLRSSDMLRNVSLEGRGDAIAAQATVVWNGVPARVGLELAEIRLRARHLGLRMRALRALGGVPVPRSAVEVGLRLLDHPLLTVVRGEGIVIIDLRQWVPEEASIRVLTVQSTARTLSVWLGPGSLADLPGRRRRRRLPAGESPAGG